MEVQEAFDKLLTTEEFRKFRNEHKEHYLAHAFTTKEKEIEKWQFGFFDRKTDKITVFEMKDEDKVMQRAPEDVYKNPDHAVPPLHIHEIKTKLEDALSAIDEKIKASYKGESINKYIIILQNVTELGTVWNITAISATFNVINFKVDAKECKILKEEKQSLTMWKK